MLLPIEKGKVLPPHLQVGLNASRRQQCGGNVDQVGIHSQTRARRDQSLPKKAPNQRFNRTIPSRWILSTIFLYSAEPSSSQYSLVSGAA